MSAAKVVSRQRRWQIRRQEAGLCAECPCPRVNATHCQQHLDAENRRSLARYRQRRQAGLCRSCGEESIQGSVYCAKHRDCRRAYERKYYQECLDALPR